MAIPANPRPFKVSQPDGTELTIKINGDEYYNFYTTADGYTIVKNNAGYYVYAKKVNGALQATTTVARDGAARSARDKAMLAKLAKRMVDDKRVDKALKAQAMRDGRMGAKTINYSQFKGLIILVQFNDCTFKRSDVKQFYQNQINKRGYTGYTNEDGTPNYYGNFTGSVRDWFYDNSLKAFDPTFDVIGPITVPYSVNFAKQTQNISRLLASAIKQARDQNLCTFKDYDLNNDGAVDMGYFIFAGVGSNTGEANDHVWPHASYFYYPISQNGVTVNFGRYACSCELYSERYNIIDGVGTMCHEFSHVLGLPDLYDTDYSGSGGESITPDEWEIMSAGGYNNMGRTPAGYSAYDRWALNFCTPKVINATGNYALKAFETENEAFRLNTPKSKEYFLIENRQPTKWDQYIPGHGMIVCRVDSSNARVWNNNTINCDPNRNYYELLRAGNSRKSDDSAPFPGSRGVTMLTNSTTPNLKTWSGDENQFVISGIAESDGVINFTVADSIQGDIEDFEDMEVTTNANLKDVQGKFANWSFVKSYVQAPGNTKANGVKSVAMKLPSALTTSPVYYDAYQVSFKVFNTTNVAAKLALAYSTNGGTTWKNALSASGNKEQVVSSLTTTELYWMLNTSRTVPVQFKVIYMSGNRNTPIYLDDFTILYTAKGKADHLLGDINNDGVVNVTDVTALINKILGVATADYDDEITDINGDGVINVTDVTALINLIVGA